MGAAGDEEVHVVARDGERGRRERALRAVEVDEAVDEAAAAEAADGLLAGQRPGGGARAERRTGRRPSAVVRALEVRIHVTGGGGGGAGGVGGGEPGARGAAGEKPRP